MKKFFIPFLSIGILLNLSSCNNDGEASENEYRYYNLDYSVFNENQTFNVKLFNKISEKRTDNFVFSPVSFNFFMGMVANGADEATRNEILSTLNITNLEDFNSANSELIKLLPKIDKKVKISIANSLWQDKNSSLFDNYISDCQRIYGAEHYVADFSSYNIIEKMNSWVSKKTEGLITEFITEPPVTEFLLFNTLYFNGAWSKWKYNVAEEIAFNNADGSVAYPKYIENRGSYDLFHQDGFFSFFMGYGSGSYKIMITIPDGFSDNSIDDLTPEIFSRLTDYASNSQHIDAKGNIRFPEFDIYNKIDLTDICKEIGLGSLFEPGKLSGISEKGHLQTIHQAVSIKFSQKGTEAAAVTSGDVNIAPPVIDYNNLNITVDKPFIFVIFHSNNLNYSKENPILFLGKVNKL